jgi:hypothetical protein
MFHNVGPRDGRKKPGSESTYGEFLVTKEGESWKGPIEELKAQNGSLFIATEFYRDAIAAHDAGKMDDKAFELETKKYREHVFYDLVWALRMVMRAVRNSPDFKNATPYSKLAAVQIGFFTSLGALTYDDKAGTWTINYDKMPDAITTLMKKCGELYVKSDPKAVADFFNYYMKGEGSKLVHADKILLVAKDMPSTLFDYRLKGL